MAHSGQGKKPWFEGGILPMQLQKHGDLSTMPATNLKSGRVQTMLVENDPEGQSNNTEETGEINEMEALLRESANPINIKRGDVVEGVIVRIDQDEILVDIGLKSEGVLSTKELPANGYGSFNELHLNDQVLVYVIQPETPDGHAVLSLKRANAERQWRIADEQYKNGELLKARVIDYNKGGLIVDVAGIRGFVPISQILNLKREEVASGGENQETAAKLASMKDKELTLKIIEINRTRNRLILSERLAVQEWRQRRREELLDELKPGEVRRGIVSNLANFGAFVDLGGADGLVHISQLAWSRVNHPSEVLHVGQEVEVQVLSVDKDKKKIALSIKRAEVDPWTTVEQRYTPGQVVTGTITKIAPFGAFARIEDGIEGLIHLSELTPGMDPKQNLHEGLQLQLRILRIDAERRRLGLSLRQADEVDTSREGEPEAPPPENGNGGMPAATEMTSLEETPPQQETTSAQPEANAAPNSRREGRGDRRERPGDRQSVGNLPRDVEEETTAMAEAFRRADRQRSKEDTEASE
jgi:small subunit ribosomal protein S1